MRRYTQEDERDHRSRPYRGHMGTGLLLHTVRGPRRDQTGGKFRSWCRSAHGGSAVSPRPTEYGLKLGFKETRFDQMQLQAANVGGGGRVGRALQERCKSPATVDVAALRMEPELACRHVL